MTDREKRISDKLRLAVAKIAATIHNDPMPSARLLSALGLIREAEGEVRGSDPGRVD